MSDLKWHKCNGSIKTYPNFLCSVCPPGDRGEDFNPIEQMMELEEDLKLLRALQAGGVDDWEWYDDAVESMED